ncbi:hypothetical protein IMZ08_19235 [Bacillus luteolus]|uniref:Group-specific protein n=1 Tax=Litchfieldia luteola TaxID=682179 RepID=A0ABR9QNV2_9BACI|nr:DUF6123 family protein [Cytobacillus luteolus]MBE4910176.1 hypothetical protein [Cytobacillus luteolus]MBP1942258.1 hypothetical protein [Cytobacillus luteolus]
MNKSVKTVEDYLSYLAEKGFIFGEDALGFISFGQHYTGASDELVNTALEITLKAQKQFDGSFYVSVLEMFKEHDIVKRKDAYKLIEERKII